MLNTGTPVEDHLTTHGLLVKREDLCCPLPGPPFSKMRGVLAHIAKRPESVIGVLDTGHSQAGHAVAYACSLLGKGTANFYPDFKATRGAIRDPQLRSRELGAELFPLPAGRSAVLYHQAKKACVGAGGYMMPNALKLEESITETAAEVLRTGKMGTFAEARTVLISASSGTIATGVLMGLAQMGWPGKVIIHQGYSRSVSAIQKYVLEKAGLKAATDVERSNIILHFIDEGYSYADQARAGEMPQWACNRYYDLKAFRWWKTQGRNQFGTALLWNIG